MATKRPKLNKDSKELVLKEYDKGVSPANLAEKWGVHPTTIRRWIRESGRNTNRFSHTTELDKDVKVQLRNVLSKFDINNLDLVISELDKNFLIEPRQDLEDEDFPVIILG